MRSLILKGLCEVCYSNCGWDDLIVYVRLGHTMQTFVKVGDKFECKTCRTRFYDHEIGYSKIWTDARTHVNLIGADDIRQINERIIKMRNLISMANYVDESNKELLTIIDEIRLIIALID